MNIEKLIVEELTHDLREWGLQGSHKEHVKFREKVMQTAIGNLKLKGNEVIFEDLKQNTFPTNYAEAYRHVLQHKDADGEVYVYSDALHHDGYLNPYYRFYDKKLKPPIVATYRRKKEYKLYSCEELDPLKRFTFHTISKKKNLFER